MSFLKGWLDYLKNHIYSIFRVHKLMYNCQITCDHNSRTFFVQALCALHIVCYIRDSDVTSPYIAY